MVIHDFTGDFELFVLNLDMLKTQGGDRPLANVFGGLIKVHGLKWRKNATKLVYHCADMPGHGSNYNNNLRDDYDYLEPDYKSLFKLWQDSNIDYHFLKVDDTTDAMLAYFRENDVPLGFKIVEENFDRHFDIVKSISLSSTMTSTQNFTKTLTTHNISLSKTGITDLEVDNSVTKDIAVKDLYGIPCTFYHLNPIHDIKEWLLEFKYDDEFFMQYADFSDETQTGVFSVERSKFKQGACRKCFDGRFTPDGQFFYIEYSMKQYKKGMADDEYEPYTQQAQLTNIAAAFAKEFNKSSQIKIEFIPAGIIEARMHNGENELFNVEPRLPEFHKFVSNNGKTNKDHDCSTG